MWGYISTEASYQSNFNVGFATTRSDVLVHLAQWQYWWWFWFAFVWTFYYLTAIKVIRYRVLKMRPKIVTSYRPHGKWGDFLACTIPMIWCLNILANSNFILRLIEWQSESSLFTVRVRARQWYWIYKFELKTFTDILTAPKNIGHNKWQINTFGELQSSDDYLHILQLRSQNKWVNKYWGEIVKKAAKVNKNHIVSIQDQFKISLDKEIQKIIKSNYREKLNFQLNSDPSDNYFNNLDLSSTVMLELIYENPTYSRVGTYHIGCNYKNNALLNLQPKPSNEFSYNNSVRYSSFLYYLDNNAKLYKQPKNECVRMMRRTVRGMSIYMGDPIFSYRFRQLKSQNKNLYKLLFIVEPKNFVNSFKAFPEIIENSRWVKRTQGVVSPIRIIKYPINLVTPKTWEQDLESLELLKIRFNESNEHIKHKVMPHTQYLTLKQKRYKRKKTILPREKYYSDSNGKKTARLRYSGKTILSDNKIFENNIHESTIQYRLFKKNKLRSDLMPVTLARRLLRTKKTLVLPAHVNITLITNSYDIIHSWFIPGLGIKLDCVPGRSTHHTFFIDNVGFYYGQCAEICGRYHHHMPIRICALPFEHFLLWWHTFGLPKLISTPSQKRYEQYYVFRKFTW